MARLTDSNTRDTLINILTGVTTKVRALIVGGELVDRHRRAATAFFYAAVRIRDDILETFGELPPRLVRDLETLIPQCTGPLVKLRMPLMDAVSMINSVPIPGLGSRCSSCGAKLDHPDLPCSACGNLG